MCVPGASAAGAGEYARADEAGTTRAEAAQPAASEPAAASAVMGWLWKRGAVRGRWVRRWYLMRRNRLCVMHHPSERGGGKVVSTKPLCYVVAERPVRGPPAEETALRTERAYPLHLHFGRFAAHETTLYVETREERNAWLAVLLRSLAEGEDRAQHHRPRGSTENNAAKQHAQSQAVQTTAQAHTDGALGCQAPSVELESVEAPRRFSEGAVMYRKVSKAMRKDSSTKADRNECDWSGYHG